VQDLQFFLSEGRFGKGLGRNVVAVGDENLRAWIFGPGGHEDGFSPHREHAFQTFSDKAGNAPPITDPTNGLTFPDLNPGNLSAFLERLQITLEESGESAGPFEVQLQIRTLVFFSGLFAATLSAGFGQTTPPSSVPAEPRPAEPPPGPISPEKTYSAFPNYDTTVSPPKTDALGSAYIPMDN
jgi:hypothetical protein